MFQEARRRLALRYLLVFIVVLLAFSAVFLVALAIVLQPAFDIAPEVDNTHQAREAYRHAIERIAVALFVADFTIFGVVAVVAYALAGRTLQPIREAHERQRRFAADASHEMRTPLAAIRATADAALSGAGSPTEALSTIVTSAEQMRSITDDLLLLARSERGSLERRRQQVDLSIVAAEAADTVRAAHVRDGASIQLQLEADLVVAADERELARIIENLVDNAIRYGGERGPVTVRTRARERDVIVDVIDHGPGISAADRERIFEAVFRVRSDAGAPSGSGLGLAIATELAERNSGVVEVETAPGEGARFSVRFPRFR
jgi:two-component system OmpR family sensor kinase